MDKNETSTEGLPLSSPIPENNSSPHDQFSDNLKSVVDDYFVDDHIGTIVNRTPFDLNDTVSSQQEERTSQGVDDDLDYEFLPPGQGCPKRGFPEKIVSGDSLEKAKIFSLETQLRTLKNKKSNESEVRVKEEQLA